jgi:hypothetical protein
MYLNIITVFQKSKDDMKFNSQSHSMEAFLDFTAPQLSIPQIACSPLHPHTNGDIFRKYMYCNVITMTAIKGVPQYIVAKKALVPVQYM